MSKTAVKTSPKVAQIEADLQKLQADLAEAQAQCASTQAEIADLAPLPEPSSDGLSAADLVKVFEDHEIKQRARQSAKGIKEKSAAALQAKIGKLEGAIAETEKSLIKERLADRTLQARAEMQPLVEEFSTLRDRMVDLLTQMNQVHLSLHSDAKAIGATTGHVYDVISLPGLPMNGSLNSFTPLFIPHIDWDKSNSLWVLTNNGQFCSEVFAPQLTRLREEFNARQADRLKHLLGSR